MILDDKELAQYQEFMLNENLLFELSVVPQMIVNKDRIIVRVNKKFCELFEYEASNILGKQTAVLTPTKEKFEEYAKYFTQTKEGIFKSEELQYKKSSGNLFWTKLEGIEIHSKKDDFLILWSFINIDKEVKYRKELEFHASSDSLSGLYNRRFFLNMANTIFNLAQRDKVPLSMIILDIDNFKNINDTYGHSIGDAVLIALSNILQEGRRKSDIICRWGGEEFVILLPETSLDGAQNIAEKIRNNIYENTLDLDENEVLKFTASFGVSEVNIEDSRGIESAINKADKALYKAKTGGRNRVST